MIITKTPFRMSFFGGGTDMENFFRQFMNYLRMCFSQLKKSVSRLDPSQAKKNIKEITDVSLVEKIIRAYPDKQLNIKQRGFVLMVRWKWNWLLYVMFCIFKIE